MIVIMFICFQVSFVDKIQFLITASHTLLCLVGSCHQDMACDRDVDGGDALQIWRVAANILNKESRTADMGCSSRFGVGRVANSSSP
jgi:hypothetical protein